MRKITTIILLFYIYLVLLIGEIIFPLSGKLEFIPLRIIPIIFLIWLVFFVCSVVFNIKNTKKLFKENNVTELMKNCKSIKLALIPFWVLHFIVSFISMVIFIGGSRMIGFLFIPIPIFFTYIFLLITSVFSIPCIVSLYKNKRIDSIVIHILLQLCFVLDIINIIYLLRIISKKGIEVPEGQTGADGSCISHCR